MRNCFLFLLLGTQPLWCEEAQIACGKIPVEGLKGPQPSALAESSLRARANTQPGEQAI